MRRREFLASIGVAAAGLPQFMINLKTAKALNIQIPPDVLAIADEMIE